MAGKLKLLLRNPRLALLLKASAFGFLFAWLYPPGAGFLRAAVFVLIALVLYLRPFFNVTALLFSFSALTALSLIFPATGLPDAEAIFLPFVKSWIPLIIPAHAFLFFIILGLKEFVLVHRLFWHEMMFAILAYEAIIAHSIASASHPVLSSAFTALVLAGLLMELVSRETEVPARRAWLGGAVLGVMVLAGVKIINFLPLGFLNSANLTTLGALMFTEILLRFYNRKLNKTIVISRAIVFVLLATLIFLTSRWHL